MRWRPVRSLACHSRPIEQQGMVRIEAQYYILP